MARTAGTNVIAKNRRAHFDYELGEKREAGLVLTGSEVRSLRENGADVSSAWVHIDARGEAWVKEMNIPPLAHARFGHIDKRPRKLLLKREEIERLRGSIDRDGLTLVVTQCYFKDGRAKLEVSLARGRKRHDKRHAIRERESAHEARVAMRRGR